MVVVDSLWYFVLVFNNKNDMKRIVVVSTNNNPDYMFYAPYIEKAWKHLGWDLCIMVTADVNHKDLNVVLDSTKIYSLPDLQLRKETIAQAGRLYACNYLKGYDVVMTSDMDLLPLSNYWNPSPNEITVYGHDLTDYTYFPMGYTAMSIDNWVRIMRLKGDTILDMANDAVEYKRLTHSEQWEEWWNYDWQMLTDRLKSEPITHVTRGRRLTGTYAYGRIDRGDSMQIPPNETLIDCHCENINVQHEVKLPKFLSIFETHYGKL